MKKVMNKRDIPAIVMKENGTSEQQLHGKQYTDNNYTYITTFHICLPFADF